ncbi:hypothetical protein HJFPF1_10180 [Paramyrothecium foliicola]|nr:hypothetical protein HJFPF1_10180 [Paramyrothecium foliicola]
MSFNPASTSRTTLQQQQPFQQHPAQPQQTLPQLLHQQQPRPPPSGPSPLPLPLPLHFIPGSASSSTAQQPQHPVHPVHLQPPQQQLPPPPPQFYNYPPQQPPPVAMNAAGMALPTPAGHQQELNLVYGMVEELSRQLAENRRVTEDIISGLGKVRSRAKAHSLGNDDILRSAAEDINAQEQNLDSLLSLLTESLEKAKYSRDSNAQLLSQYANALALMLKQFHEYKAKHVADVAAWHRSYRAQLDEARRENCRLREQIWEMQAHAARANDSLRHFRRCHDEDEARWARRVDDKALRQELRFWKRMAMPELDDDDPYWSDDDDIIDPAEKDRLRDLEHRAAQEQLADSTTDDSDGQPNPMGPDSLVGGIAMQRENAIGQPMPMPPPRPLSAASSTGSTG